MITNDADRLKSLQAAYDLREGSRVGDYLMLWTDTSKPCPHYRWPWTRFTHDWGDHLQTGGVDSSFHLGNGFVSYSGGLDSGVAKSDLVATCLTMPGWVWHWKDGISGAHRGIDAQIPFRVFTLRDGANTEGIEFEKEYYYLNCLDEEYHKRTCNYWYTITKNAFSHTAFTEKEQLMAWMEQKGLVLKRPLPVERGTADFQRLIWKAVSV